MRPQDDLLKTFPPLRARYVRVESLSVSIYLSREYVRAESLHDDRCHQRWFLLRSCIGLSCELFMSAKQLYRTSQLRLPFDETTMWRQRHCPHAQ